MGPAGELSFAGTSTQASELARANSLGRTGVDWDFFRSPWIRIDLTPRSRDICRKAGRKDLVTRILGPADAIQKARGTPIRKLWAKQLWLDWDNRVTPTAAHKTPAHKIGPNEARGWPSMLNPGNGMK